MSLLGDGNKELTSGEIETKKFIDSCSQAGIDVIELLWYQIRNSTPKCLGVEKPVLSQRQNKSFAATIDFDVSWNKSGALVFYPDESGRCWGYIADTQYNREHIISDMYASGRVRIIDSKVKSDIDAYLETQQVEKKSNPFDNEGLSKRQLEAIKLQKENEALMKQLAEMQEKLDAKPPLAGKRIKKNKIKTEEKKEVTSAD